MSDVNKLVNKILEGSDVRSVINEFKVTLDADGANPETFEIDPFKNNGKPYAKGAGPKGRPKGSRNKNNIYRIPDAAKTGQTLVDRINAYDNSDFQGSGRKDSGLPFAIVADGPKSTLTFKFAETEYSDIKSFIKEYMSKATTFEYSYKIVDKGDYEGELSDVVVTIQKDRTLKDSGVKLIFRSDSDGRICDVSKTSGSYHFANGKEYFECTVVPGEVVTLTFKYDVYLTSYSAKIPSEYFAGKDRFFATVKRISFVVPKSAVGDGVFYCDHESINASKATIQTLDSYCGWIKSVLIKPITITWRSSSD
jgi:hypothetical protein